MATARASDAAAKETALAALRAEGWTDDGATHCTIVRMPVDCFGGRHDAQIGGRTRLHKPGTDEYVTVGPRTTCFYRKAGGKITDSRNVPTRSIA